MKHSDIQKAIVVQKHQADRAEDKLFNLKEKIEGVEAFEHANRRELEDIEGQLTQLFGDLNINREELDLESIEPIISLTENELSEIDDSLPQFEKLDTIEFRNWHEYLQEVDSYVTGHNIDLSVDPIRYLLSPGQISKIEKSYVQEFSKYKWDKWDYIFAGGAGVLASLTDFLLVRIPKTMGTGQYAGQKGSPITEWLRKYNINEKADDHFTRNDWFANWARSLEDCCKVPYDKMETSINDQFIERIPGMSGKTHRLQSLGHDPVLGFIFGVLDILRGTITGFSYDSLLGKHSYFVGQDMVYLPGQGPKLIEAILKHIGHLVSDVATPAGLPAPFFTAFQGINAGSFGEKGRTVGQLARWMYTNGYDFRHFLVSGITPAVVEIVLRAYIMIRHYCEHGETPIMVASNPKYRNMLLFGHAIAAAGNIGKIALYQGNPLAINLAEWYALIRYLVPCLKYWLFDKNRELEKFYLTRWEDMLVDANSLYTSPSFDNIKMIELGNG